MPWRLPVRCSSSSFLCSADRGGWRLGVGARLCRQRRGLGVHSTASPRRAAQGIWKASWPSLRLFPHSLMGEQSEKESDSNSAEPL